MTLTVSSGMTGADMIVRLAANIVTIGMTAGTDVMTAVTGTTAETDTIITISGPGDNGKRTI